MINNTHLKLLLKKNMVTLWRNVGFIYGLIVTPIILMGAFIGIKWVSSNGDIPEGNFWEYFYYTDSFFDPTQFNPQEYVYPWSHDFAGSIPSNQTGDLKQIVPYISCADPRLKEIGRREKLIIYYPETDTLSATMPGVLQAFDAYNLHVQGMEDEWLLITEVFHDYDAFISEYTEDEKNTICFGLSFTEFDLANDNYQVQLHFPNNAIPHTTNDPYNLQNGVPDFVSFQMYESAAFMSVYTMLTFAINQLKTSLGYPLPIESMQIGYIPMKNVEFTDLPPMATLQLTENFPFFFMFTYLVPLFYMVTKLAEEKQSKAREGMKMMGLNDGTYFLSYFIFHMFIICIVTVAIEAILIPFLLYKTSIFLFVLFNLLYGGCLFGFSVLVVSFFPNKRSSAQAAVLFHIISYYLIGICNQQEQPLYYKMLMCLFPNIAMPLTLSACLNFELQDVGLTFDTWTIPYANFSFQDGIIMLAVDMFLYAFLGYYFDQIIQSDYGISRPWYFLCTSEFWGGKKARVEAGEGSQLLLDADEEQLNEDPNTFERVPDSLKRMEKTGDCLKIRKLRKEFGAKVAVNDVDMTMYNGQIFALLGHNGAGKTTTISMLTGLLQANSGRAAVKDIDILNQMDEFRKSLGVCPQHDVLFEYLTVKEHLELFAAFKGDQTNIEAQVEKMIKDIDLLPARDQISKTLSGGQKRKLSVGIALIGNSKIVLLDEPSSGMDTADRRRLWEMLKTQKNDRIIILTTHYMDEADILGDRIAIMAEGKVQCCGTSLFLKNKYGVGYNLVIAKKTRDDAPQIDKFIIKNIDNAIKLQEVSSEMTYQLPTASSAQFKSFFSKLDQNLDQLGIQSYGVGITTLEEVFLKIGHGEEEEAAREERYKKENNALQNGTTNFGSENLDEQSKSNALDNYNCGEMGIKEPKEVFKLHFSALLQKKILMLVRDPKNLFIEIFFPILLILGGLALSTVSIFFNGPSRDLSPSLFPGEQNLVYNQNSAMNTGTDNEIETFFNDYLLNTTGQGFEFDNRGSISIVVDDNDFKSNANQLDDYVFDHRDTFGTFFGNYYFHEINRASGIYSVVVYSNTTAQDTCSAYGAEVVESLLQYHYQNPELIFELKSQPFPLSTLERSVVNLSAGTFVAVLFSIAFMLVADALIQNIIREREKNIKHQIIVSGGSLVSYWSANYVGDIFFQIIPCLVATIGIGVTSLDIPDNIYLFIAFVFCNPVFVYFFSFFFKKDNSGALFIRLFYVMTGGIAPLVITILQVISEDTQNVANIMKWFFYILPIFDLDYGILSINDRALVAQLNKAPTKDPLDPSVGGTSLYFLIGETILFWILVAGMEMGWFRSLNCFASSSSSRRNAGEAQQYQQQSNRGRDADVVDEEMRVRNTNDLSQLPVKVEMLKKSYGNLTAVNQLSFGMEYGECFALLGISGAGKSTTFKCLTGELEADQGQLFVNGYNIGIPMEYSQARKHIGYCPQFDAIFEGLTVREHLDIYARLKCIGDDVRPRLVEQQIKDMDLMNYTNVRANQLSGGNKRKMSVAMAMIGNPPIVFLDEPSTGVDPQAKRFMWNIVSKISTQRKKSAVIITTHSMEEAEALCTKMGIMVQGQFKCFGSSQHIKDKFGTGYEMEIKIRTLSEDEISDTIHKKQLEKFGSQVNREQLNQILANLAATDLISEIRPLGIGHDFDEAFNQGQTVSVEEIIRWVFTETKGSEVLQKLEKMFKSVTVIEHYSNSYTFRTSRDNYSIGFLFGLMEDVKGELDISEYSCQQTTLEQIFNQFAKEADGNQERRDSYVRRGDSKGADILK